MHYDALTLACMAHELQTTLAVGRMQLAGRVQQVVLPGAHSVGLEVYAQRTRHNLLLSAETGAAHVYCPSQKARRGVEKETPLLLLLRKYVRGATLTQVRQPDPTERVLWLDFAHPQQGATALVVELIGRHPNILLLNASGRILECVRRASGDAAGARTLLPGRDYAPPAPQDKLAPLDEGLDDYYARLAQAVETPGKLWKALVEAVAGVSPSQARELAWRATGDADAPAQGTPMLAVVQALQELWGPLTNGAWTPGIVHAETSGESIGRIVGYAPYVVHFRGAFEEQPTLSAAIELALAAQETVQEDAATGAAGAEDATRGAAGTGDASEESSRQSSAGVDAYAGLRKQVAAQLGRARRRVERQLAALSRDEPEPGEPERLRTQAEWLLALQGQIAPGQQVLEVELGADSGLAGVDADGTLRIPLENQKSPVEQAQQLFKRAGKLKRAAEFIPQRRARLQADLDYLAQLASDLALAENQPEIGTVEQELVATRLLPPKAKAGPRQPPASEPLRFVAPQGFEVVVGRNARQNELVTFKIAQPEDMWLHARGVPGAHVVIRNGGQPLDPATVEFAAQLAAYYSQARHERAAVVIATPRKQITRAPGGRKGQVLVRQEETVTVQGEMPEGANP